MRKELPILICALAAVVYILSTFANPSQFPALQRIKGELDSWYLIVYATAYGVGLVNLILIHSKRVRQQKEGWPYSGVLLILLFATLGIGVFTTANGTYTDWLFQYVNVHPQTTVFSILVFYIASAAYRAFRIRTFEASVLMLAAVIMMLGRAPIGEVIWTKLPALADWVLNNPNAAGMRGITIAATLGGVATALRVVLGIERGHLGGAAE